MTTLSTMYTLLLICTLARSSTILCCVVTLSCIEEARSKFMVLKVLKLIKTFKSIYNFFYKY